MQRAFPLQFQDRRSITSLAPPKRIRAWGRLTGFSNAFFGCFPVAPVGQIRLKGVGPISGQLRLEALTVR